MFSFSTIFPGLHLRTSWVAASSIRKPILTCSYHVILRKVHVNLGKHTQKKHAQTRNSGETCTRDCFCGNRVLISLCVRTGAYTSWYIIINLHHLAFFILHRNTEVLLEFVFFFYITCTLKMRYHRSNILDPESNNWNKNSHVSGLLLAFQC